MRKVLEARAAEIRLAELVCLDHRTHRAVEHEDAFGGSRAQGSGGVGMGRGFLVTWHGLMILGRLVMRGLDPRIQERAGDNELKLPLSSSQNGSRHMERMAPGCADQVRA